MLKIDKKTLDKLEEDYPGIAKTIMHYEHAKLPTCSSCGSNSTAKVGSGLIGRTINIAAATTKFKLLSNDPKPGEYFCNACDKFFSSGSRRPRSRAL